MKPAARASVRQPQQHAWSQRFFHPGQRHSREALLIVAGGPGQSGDYLARRLARLGHTLPVVFYDQAGSGRSAHLPTHMQEARAAAAAAAAEDAAGDAAGAAAAPTAKDAPPLLRSVLGVYVEELLGVARRYGLRYVHLAGHGFGAAVALEAAIALDGGSGSGSGQHSGRRPPRHSSPRLLSLALLSPAIDLPQWRLDAAYAESVLGDFSFTL